jgi:hypothetical protein
MSKDSLKIKITYNGKSLTVDVPRNKPFKILREKTQSFFFPLPQNYSYFEKKIDLTPLEDKNLGEIFGTRNLIILTLKESNPYIQSKLKESNSAKKQICAECDNNNEVSYYCRDCNTFICKACRLNEENGKHYSHELVQLFDNNDNKGVKRNVELYKQLLMNDINLIKNKINKCNNLNSNKVDITVYKKILFEKVLLIGKLLYKINEETKKNEKEDIIKDKSDIEKIRNDLEFIRNDNTIVEINNDPLIEFNKINEFDKQLINMNAKMKEQIHNNNVMLMIENTENKVENLFSDLINNN